ncbi:MAG: hypothetical protein CL832_01820 [Crocinitomicaceae bacterium]|nr:hypothetical protein [Crocinitomicaceae bacterium]|tara:strand:+ start:804 stop:1022 length:219 start_codon:yes stop_codon:yes gene_type:complete
MLFYIANPFFENFGVQFILLTMALPMFVGLCISEVRNIYDGGWKENVNETVAWMVGVLVVTWICLWVWVTFF